MLAYNGWGRGLQVQNAHGYGLLAPMLPVLLVLAGMSWSRCRAAWGRQNSGPVPAPRALL